MSGETIVELIVGLLGLLGLVFGSGGGIWAYLSMKHKSELAAQVETMKVQQDSIRTSMEAMQTTVSFLRTRLDQSDAEYIELQKHHNNEVKEMKEEHAKALIDLKQAYKKEIDELQRLLRIMHAQFNDCKRALNDKLNEVNELKTSLDKLMEKLQSVLPTKPLINKSGD